jgi:type II secretory pathway component PulC
MRQPFWIINTSLLLLALVAAGFVYFARPTIPAREEIEPAPYRTPTKMESATFNISKIYEYDLFDTYQKELLPTESRGHVSPLPQPPTPLPIRIPEEPKPQFIEPLPITLKGIVVVLNDDSKNRAIIMDNRSNKEISYRVGDMIEDAQLIRIFSNKVILMRSNGQQEVLYLREKDAKLDPTYANIDSWDGVIAQTNPYHYTVNTAEFINRIQSLGQFIDTLELITAYKQGESVGCRVNNVGPGSLGQALGFNKHDIILKINDISIALTQNRLTIYNQIIGLKTNDTIRVTLLRNNQEITMEYLLQEVRQARKQDIGLRKPSPEEVTAEQRKQLEQKHSFAPTLQEIRSREKTNMLEKGKRPTHNVLSNLNE